MPEIRKQSREKEKFKRYFIIIIFLTPVKKYRRHQNQCVSITMEIYFNLVTETPLFYVQNIQLSCFPLIL